MFRRYSAFAAPFFPLLRKHGPTVREGAQRVVSCGKLGGFSSGKSSNMGQVALPCLISEVYHAAALVYHLYFDVIEVVLKFDLKSPSCHFCNYTHTE